MGHFLDFQTVKVLLQATSKNGFHFSTKAIILSKSIFPTKILFFSLSSGLFYSTNFWRMAIPFSVKEDWQMLPTDTNMHYGAYRAWGRPRLPMQQPHQPQRTFLPNWKPIYCSICHVPNGKLGILRKPKQRPRRSYYADLRVMKRGGLVPKPERIKTGCLRPSVTSDRP